MAAGQEHRLRSHASSTEAQDAEEEKAERMPGLAESRALGLLSSGHSMVIALTDQQQLCLLPQEMKPAKIPAWAR